MFRIFSKKSTLCPFADADDAAAELIRNHSIASMGSCFVPVPFFDLAALTVIQGRLIRKLAEVYGTAYRFDLAKELIGLVITSGVYIGLTSPTQMALRFIPGLGTVAAGLGAGVTGAASTYALGKVFQQHFASGGTFLSFDPESVRESFKRYFIEGKSLFATASAS